MSLFDGGGDGFYRGELGLEAAFAWVGSAYLSRGGLYLELDLSLDFGVGFATEPQPGQKRFPLGISDPHEMQSLMDWL